MNFVLKGEIEKVRLGLDEFDGVVEMHVNDYSELALLSPAEARKLAKALNEKADELENKEEK